MEVVFGKNTAGAKASPSNEGTNMVEAPDLKMNTDGAMQAHPYARTLMKREAICAEMVKEVVIVLKAIFVVCVALLFVLILVLLVLLVK